MLKPVRLYITGADVRLVITKIVNNLRARFGIDEKEFQIDIELNILVDTLPLYLELLLENILEDAVESVKPTGAPRHIPVSVIVEQEPEFLLLSILGLDLATVAALQSEISLPLQSDVYDYKKKLRLLVIRKAIEVLGGTFENHQQGFINHFRIRLPSNVSLPVRML
jgi:hypothetical protein